MTTKQFSEAMNYMDDELITEAITYKRKKNAWQKWAAMAACLCLVIVGALAYRGTDRQPVNSDLLVVNEAESVMSVDMDVQVTSLSKLPHDVWMSVLEEFRGAVGVTYEEFIAKIPNNFECCNFYSLSIPGYKDADLRDEYRLHDYVFEYRSKSGGELTIAICSYEEPLRDCFIECDDPQQSEINGVPVVVYGYQGSFMVQFSYENINYDIETSNISLEEMENLLTAIVK